MASQTLDYRNLQRLPEWQALSRKLDQISTSYYEEILDLAKDGCTNEILDRAGRISMIKDMFMWAKEVNNMGGQSDAINQEGLKDSQGDEE